MTSPSSLEGVNRGTVDEINVEEQEREHDEGRLTAFVIQVTALASLGGLLFGYDMGAISGALPQLAETFELSSSQQEWVVSILFLGGGLGAATGGYFCDMWGRQRTIVATDFVFLLGAIVLSSAHSYQQLLVGRFGVGIAVAVSGVADVSYLHEVAPPAWRGAMVSVNEACISLGFLLAFGAGVVWSHHETQDWRKIFGLAGALACVQGIGMCRMPESPVWLAQQGRLRESQEAFRRINGKDSHVTESSDKINGHRPRSSDVELTSATSLAEVVDSEIAATAQLRRNSPTSRSSEKLLFDSSEGNSAPRQTSYNTYDTNAVPSPPLATSAGPRRRLSKRHLVYTGLDQTSSDGSLHIDSGSPVTDEVGGQEQQPATTRALLVRYRKQIWIALFLAVTQQFCGQTNVLNYAPLIFAEATKVGNEDGEEEDAPVWSSLAIGGVKFAVTCIVILRIESIGRRKLLLWGMTTIALGLALLMIAFGGFAVNSNGEQDSEAAVKQLSTFALALPGVLLVVTGYSMSFGPLTWLLTSELFPTQIRGRALGASTIVTYLAAALVTRTFISMSESYGPTKVFAIYLIVTLAGCMFAYLAIPDTGGQTVEEIEISLQRMYWWRFDERLARMLREEQANGMARQTEYSLQSTPERDSDRIHVPPKDGIGPGIADTAVLT